MQVVRECDYCQDEPESSMVYCKDCDTVVCQQCAYNHNDHEIIMTEPERGPHVFIWPSA
jgi:hypothetical protein